jgi:hypothetical protein
MKHTAVKSGPAADGRHLQWELTTMTEEGGETRKTKL